VQVAGFSASLRWTEPRVRLSRKERRMMFANAYKFNRKSGVAKWRDLRFLFQFSRTLLAPEVRFSVAHFPQHCDAGKGRSEVALLYNHD
jgi:hypothetical protein